MIGAFGVGKTSLVRRFVDGFFGEKYLTTVGVKIDRKDVSAGGESVALMLWDLAGEDDLSPLQTAHLRGASAYILVADGCRAETLAKAIELQGRIEEQFGELPFVLAINKADLRETWEVKTSDVESRGWTTFETSAMVGLGVEEIFLTLAEILISKTTATEESDE